MAHLVGDIAVGKLADLVMFKPENFGVRPETVIKGGLIAWANVSCPRVGQSLQLLNIFLSADRRCQRIHSNGSTDHWPQHVGVRAESSCHAFHLIRLGAFDHFRYAAFIRKQAAGR